MTSRNGLSSEIQRLFCSEPEVVRVCEAIVNYVENHKSPEDLHLTYSLLRKLTQPPSDRCLLVALQFLTGASANLLDMKYEFLDEHGEYHPVDKTEVAAAKREGGLIHPVSGDVIREFQEALLVYFTPKSVGKMT